MLLVSLSLTTNHKTVVYLHAQGTLIFALLKFTPLRYNNTYQYPWWGHAFGLFLAFSSVLVVPIWFLYSLAVTPGTMRQVHGNNYIPNIRGQCRVLFLWLHSLFSLFTETENND